VARPHHQHHPSQRSGLYGLRETESLKTLTPTLSQGEREQEKTLTPTLTHPISGEEGG